MIFSFDGNFSTFSQEGQIIISAATYYFNENGVAHVTETDFLEKKCTNMMWNIT